MFLKALPLIIMELVNWSRKEPTNEVRFCSILYFIHKIVRKIGQIEMLSNFTKRSEIEYSTYKL